ncbi:MAG TPA: TrkH family potassium uptake protein [Dehalococcoidia bacterium]
MLRVARVRPETVELRAPRVRRVAYPSPAAVIWGFAALIAAGSLALALPFASEEGRWTDPLTALFTATSAVCVTGLVVVDTQEHWSFFGELVILVLMQLGGLGFLTSSTLILLLMGRRLSLRDRLLMQEVMGGGTLGGAAALLRRIVVFALGVEAVGAALLAGYFAFQEPLHVALWYGLFHAVSAFNNAGFDLFGGFRSLAGHQDQPFLLAVIALLIIAGGLGYAVVADVAQERRFRRLALDTKLVLVTTGLLLLLGGVLFYLMEYGNRETLGAMEAPQAALHAVFFAVTPRTAGFASLNVGLLREETLFLLIALMFIGGAAGSTAGGIKVNTLAVLAVAVISSVKGRRRVVALGREIPGPVVMRALTVAMLAMATVFAAALLLTIGEPFQFLAVLFEATSAFGTVGLSTGITPGFSAFGKLILVVAMFVGRLGPLTLAFALTRREQTERFRFAEDSVRIG